MEFRKNTDTPSKFLSNIKADSKAYTNDSLAISKQLKKFLLAHDDFFSSKEYFEGTDIIVDTIVYSPDFKKLGILIITKNPTSRQIIPTKNEDWYYNATSYLGVKENDTLVLSWLGPNFVNYVNKKEILNDISDACFRTFVSKDTSKPTSYKYNFNDTRFWTSYVWQQMEDRRIKKQEFEEEKKKHPENVYEPPK